MLITAGLLKPENSLLQPPTESSQPIRKEIGNTSGPVKLASSVSVFTEAISKYIFKYPGNYQVKRFKNYTHSHR
jgi:hypothetical protein